MAKKIMKPKKIKKINNIKKNNNSKDKIEKKPYSNEERLEKLRQDRITIAKRYEEMRLYDEAILYYKKLGLAKDVERVMNTKRDIYHTKAREFEKVGKYEDALRLYENLNLVEDVARLKKLVGDDEFGLGLEEPSVPGEQTTIAETKPEQQVQLVQEPQEPEERHDDYIANESKPELPMKGPPKRLAEVDGPGDEPGIEDVQEQEQEQVPEPPKQAGNNKPFKICPYCGEELNLPKNPNFCPYCKERFV
jgi:tetratricopeptide (TPR) repeat protein